MTKKYQSMYNRKTQFIIALLLLGAAANLFFSACKKDNTTESELITHVQAHLIATDNSFNQEFSWKDPDGDGLPPFSIEPITIPAGKTYTCHLHVYDETKDPVVEVSDEIAAESAEHLFTYTITGVNVQIAYDDQDSNGEKFGLDTRWTVGVASAGTVNIVLHHEPTDKNNPGNPGGDVDFDITIPVVVQ